MLYTVGYQRLAYNTVARWTELQRSIVERKTMYVKAENTFAAEDAATERAFQQFEGLDVRIIQATLTGTERLYEVLLELGAMETAGKKWSPVPVNSIGPEYSLVTDSQAVWGVLDSIGVDYDTECWNSVFYRVEDGEIVEVLAAESNPPRTHHMAYRLR